MTSVLNDFVGVFKITSYLPTTLLIVPLKLTLSFSLFSLSSASMASLRNLFILFSLIFFSNPHLSLSTRPTFNLLRPSIAAIHDLLPQYGFPKGLIPNAVKSYSIFPDGSFSVELDRPCYVQFDELVFYDKEIRGKLRYGSVSDVSGIQAKKLFLWVSVTGMTMDSDSGMIEFHVGALSQKLPAKQFEVIPNCKNKGCQDARVESRFGSI